MPRMTCINPNKFADPVGYGNADTGLLHAACGRCPPCQHNARRDLFIAAAMGMPTTREPAAIVALGEEMLRLAGS